MIVPIHRVYGDAVTGPTLRNLDLNLLPTLDALLRERNVTRAAERLGLSQPAVSAALGRLRRHFGDELLHRTGNQYELTPLAQQLRAPTQLALAGAYRVFDASPQFDPTSSDRTFRLMMSDYATAVLGERLVRRLSEIAPHVRLALRQTDPEFVDNAAENLRTVDGVVLPHGFLTDIPFTDLFDDTWVCVVSPDNDRVGDELTMADLAALPWVVMWDLPTAFAPAARQLSMLGRRAPGRDHGRQLPRPAVPRGRHPADRRAPGPAGAPARRHGRRPSAAVPVGRRTGQGGVLVAPLPSPRPGPRVAPSAPSDSSAANSPRSPSRHSDLRLSAAWIPHAQHRQLP